MIRMSAVVLAALCSFAVSAMAQEKIKIEKIVSGSGDMVAVFDEKGGKKGELPKEAFPSVPFDAADYNRNTRYVKVNAGGQEVWLSPFQVQVSAKAQVLTECQTAQRVSGTTFSSRGASECK
ncbi:hypothetical protein FBZ82_107299 [Azospirillum brasilense]|uniref:Uncharacterized protein n=1 Tax=Azospirillum brasilense TaxID=192 RepID=A0A560B439_AZOBR|nr:hypothetical protein [Azospirillum brasilense]TWA67322.1 hypothetical protein FBZ82_107299 [Azospirillum brasilense]